MHEPFFIAVKRELLNAVTTLRLLGAPSAPLGVQKTVVSGGTTLGLSSYMLKVCVISMMSLAVLTGCKSINPVRTATALGTVGGETVGEVFGQAYGNAVEGANMGERLGQATGAVVGFSLDKQASDLKKELPDAKISRSDYGILAEFETTKLFGKGRSMLSANGKKNLVQLANIIKKYPDTYVAVDCQKISKLRKTKPESSDNWALSIVKNLEAAGVNSQHITVTNKCNISEPHNVTSDKIKEQNRYIEVHVEDIVAK